MMYLYLTVFSSNVLLTLEKPKMYAFAIKNRDMKAIKI